MNAVNAENVGREDVRVTADGYVQLRSELETLRAEGRRQMTERLSEAREKGDLADDPVLYDLFVEQAQLERRIAALEAQLAGAK